MKTEVPFWIVWEEGSVVHSPTLHTSYQSALAEADRLSQINPGERFHILEWCDTTERLNNRYRNYSDLPERAYFRFVNSFNPSNTYVKISQSTYISLKSGKIYHCLQNSAERKIVEIV